MKKSIIAIASLILFSSCGNLDHINTYAHNSAESMEDFHDIHFSFNSFCTQYSSAAIDNNLQTSIKDLPQPDCSLFKNSDSALHIMHQVLLLYIQGLEKISDKDLVSYNLDATVDNLTTLQSKLGFTLKDKQITSAKNIVTKLLNAALNGYRRKRLKQILLETKGDFDNVMDAYMFGITALRAEADAALVNYRTLYTFQFLEMTHEDAIKILAVNDYRKKQTEFADIQQTINQYIQSLQVIKDGYDSVTASANDLTSVSLKTLLHEANKKLAALKEQFEIRKSNN